MNLNNLYTKVAVLFFLCFFSTMSMAQNPKMDAFYAKYKYKPNTTTMLLPGWLVRFGLSFTEEEKELKDFRPLMRGLNNMRLMVMEEENHASPEEVNTLIEHARKHQFNDLVSVREGDTRVNILIKTTKGKKKELIKNILIVVNEEDELVLVSFNGRWKKELLKELLEEQGGDFMKGMVGMN